MTYRNDLSPKIISIFSNSSKKYPEQISLFFGFDEITYPSVRRGLKTDLFLDGELSFNNLLKFSIVYDAFVLTEPFSEGFRVALVRFRIE